ncbi:MAG: DUF4833 domain-containing protein [Saprospiraceae bacterium]
MFFNPDISTDNIAFGYDGRPDTYPDVEDYPELLFYIQRNQNTNSVIYELNNVHHQLINLHEPIKIKWANFDQNGICETNELNIIQKKLAYGYHHHVISADLIEFRFVSYDDMKFYLAKNSKDRFRVFTKIGDTNIQLRMIYVYAEDLGVFPQVKYAEFFGTETNTGVYFNKKLILQP